MGGILIAGNILVDRINEIRAYPSSGQLEKIKNVKMAVGGCVPNVAIDLKKLSPSLHVAASGKIGRDDNGNFVFSALAENGVDTSGIRISDKPTSFTEVMSVTGSERTFFTFAGASADFGFSDIDFESFDVSMLHLGYFLLLDKVDAGDGVEILKEAKRRGITTSIDMVTENSDRYSLVRNALQYVDNIIINEAEAAGLSGNYDSLDGAAHSIRDMGVSGRVIIHSPKLSLCLSDNGLFSVPSLDLQKDFIKGSTGAGDAFCAACLLSIYDGKGEEEMLSFASAAAACNLSEADSVSGMRSEAEVRAIAEKYGRLKL